MDSCGRAEAARLAAITSGGAIPETALFTVVAEPEGIVVGTLDEDFAVESNAGDIMLLGNTSWRSGAWKASRPGAGRGCARRAAQRAVLAWEKLRHGRQELSSHVAGLRQEISDRLRDTLRRLASRRTQPQVAADHRLAERRVRAG